MTHTLKNIVLCAVLLCSATAMRAQGTIDLLNYNGCTIKYYTWDYDVTQYDNNGNALTYGWVGGVGFNNDRHKVITTTGGTDPHVPIAEVPQGSTSSVRLGTGKYNDQFDGNCNLYASETAKGGGVVFQYDVTEENALLYINYAALLTDALPDHVAAMENMMGEYCWQYCPYDDYGNPVQCPYVYGAYALFEYESDWEYQQPYIRFFLGVDGQEIECASKHQLLYDTQGNRVNLANSWRTTSFDVQDPSNPCGVYYHYDAYYRDWTLMAVDLTPFIGHTISFGAEYKDCAQAGWLFPVDEGGNVYTNYPEIYTCDDHHLARLYLTASCAPAGDGRNVESPLTITGENCRANQLTLEAPDGFYSYRWYSSSNNSTLSTSKTCTYTFPRGEQEAFIYCDVTNNLTAGCGGQVETTTLKLYVQNDCKCESTIATPETVCADADYLRIEMDYTQGSPVSFDITFDEAAQAQGFQNITNQQITNPAALNIPMPKPEAGFIRPDRYNATLVIHQSCEEDKAIPFGFYVLYPTSVLRQKWDDVLAVRKADYNGGYQFSSIRWYKNGELFPGQGTDNSYIYLYPNKFEAGDSYWAELTRTDDGKTFCTCPVTPVPADEGGQQQEQPDQQQPARGRINVSAITDGGISLLHISAELSGMYSVYDLTGSLVMQGMFGAAYGAEEFDLRPASKGTCLIVFRADDGTVETRKVLVY